VRRTIPLLVVTLLASLLGVVAPTAAGAAVTRAVFTTIEPGEGGAGTCQNGDGEVNCNIYVDKGAVWLSGGPAAAALGDGTYYFAVVEPGGQRSATADDAAKNLSADAYTNRTFSLAGGTVAYSGTHTFTGNRIRLMDYDDTSNDGGEYILLVCSLAAGYPASPDACKYDAFKVRTPEPEPDPVPPAVVELDLTTAATATATFTRTFGWSIDKGASPAVQHVPAGTAASVDYAIDADRDGGVDSGWAASGTVTVANPNDHDVTGVDVTVTLAGADCAVTDGAGIAVAALGSAERGWTCTYASAPAGTTDTATASATWTDFGSPTTGASSDVVVDFSGGPTTVVDAGAEVTDSMAGPWSVTDSSSIAYSHAFADDPAGTCSTHGNTATVTAADSGASASDDADVTVCVGADLGVTGTAGPQFTRTYGWSVTKRVDRSLVEQLGGSATLAYGVDATQTGFADSAWGVTGSLTLTNPNDFEAVAASTSVTTTNGGDCAVSPSPVDVPAAGSVVATFGCLWASAPSPVDGAVQATVTWDAGAAATPGATATASTPISFAVPTNRVNDVVTVVDTYAGSLGALTATDAAPFASASYGYTRTVAVPANNCYSVPNTASIPVAKASATVSTTVCGPARTGALTIGYWQNKNGQSTITGGSATAGVCASGAFLRTYAPFQDLGATASCSAVASYVSGVIKAASAAGAAMNAMLKAQMLATALDVFFSEPGRNPIAAPVSIGAVVIDVSKVCKNIGTCSIWESTSSVFGGATNLSVRQLLALAAGQANAGGSAWYGQVKATQELAKDTFDAINNAVAFSVS
jgi:hypothetical protein